MIIAKWVWEHDTNNKKSHHHATVEFDIAPHAIFQRTTNGKMNEITLRAVEKIHDAALTKWQPMRHFNSFIYASNTCYKFMCFSFCPLSRSQPAFFTSFAVAKKALRFYFSFRYYAKAVKQFQFFFLTQFRNITVFSLRTEWTLNTMTFECELSIYILKRRANEQQKRQITAIFHFLLKFTRF